jgi:hypothetical protein
MELQFVDGFRAGPGWNCSLKMAFEQDQDGTAVCRWLLSRTRMELQFVDGFRAGPGWNCSSMLVLLESCMTYTIAECTVNKLLMTDI